MTQIALISDLVEKDGSRTGALSIFTAIPNIAYENKQTSGATYNDAKILLSTWASEEGSVNIY